MQEIFYAIASAAGVIWILKTFVGIAIYFGGSDEEQRPPRGHAHVVPLDNLPEEVKEKLRESLK